MIYIAACQIQGFHYQKDIRLQVVFNVWQPAYIRSDSEMNVAHLQAESVPHTASCKNSDSQDAVF